MNKLCIRKLGIFSVAKMYCVMCLVLSLLISIPYGLFIIGFSLLGASAGRGNEALALGGFGIVGGIAVMIIIPIIYAIVGFIAGALSALIYNIFAGIVGGIQIEVENIP